MYVLAFNQEGLGAQDFHYTKASDVVWFGILNSRLELCSEIQSLICKDLI